MIDLHNHILPGADDGAENVRESIDIAREFVREGVTRIVATPHSDPERGAGISTAEVEELAVALQSELRRQNIPLQVGPGNEIFLTPLVPALLSAGQALPLDGGPALLVECSFSQRPLYLEKSLSELVSAGYLPILAHPERYSYIEDDGRFLGTIAGLGGGLQLTAPALLGEYGDKIRNTAERLLRRGLYALAASDRHHPGPARSLADLHGRIDRLTDLETADLLLRINPARVLIGQAPIRPAAQPVTGPWRLGQWLRLSRPSNSGSE